MNNKFAKYKKPVSIFTATLLFIAIFDLPYGYYNLLRLVVTLSAAYLAWVAHNLDKQFWSFIMVAIALLFNPIAPVYLDKATWVIIDFIASILFLVSIFKIELKE